MGIIFDLDGTLLNTIEDIANITNFALRENGFSEHDKKAYSRMVGYGLKNLVTQALPEQASLEEINKVYDCLIREYKLRPVQSTCLYPGITELLDELSIRKIPMAILSNKLHEITVQIVNILLKKWGFVSVLGNRIGIPKKPDPCSALEISRIMKVAPETMTFVGDSGTDIKTALACHMRPIGVSWGYRSVEDIRQAGCKIIIDSPLELLPLL